MGLKPIAPELWQLSGIPPNAINVYLAGDILIDAGTRLARQRILRQVIDRPALSYPRPSRPPGIGCRSV